MITQNILNVYQTLATFLTWFINIDFVEFKMYALLLFILFIYVAVWLTKILAHRHDRGVKR